MLLLCKVSFLFCLCLVCVPFGSGLRGSVEMDHCLVLSEVALCYTLAVCASVLPYRYLYAYHLPSVQPRSSKYVLMHLHIAYNDVASPNSGNDFVILDYMGSRDTLYVASTSTGGLEAMKVHLSKPSQDARFGLLNVENRLLLWSFLPSDSLSGVKRARSLVHQRSLASALKHYASLTVSNVDTFSHAIVRSKLRLDGGSGSLPPSPNIQQTHFTSSRPVSPNPLSQDLRPPALPTKDRSGTSSAKSSPTHLSPRSDSFAQAQTSLGRESPIFSTMTSHHSSSSSDDDDDERHAPLPSPIALPNSYLQSARPELSTAISNVAVRHEPAPTPPRVPTPDQELTRTRSESEDIKRAYLGGRIDDYTSNLGQNSQNQLGQPGQVERSRTVSGNSTSSNGNANGNGSGRQAVMRITPPSVDPLAQGAWRGYFSA